jgi:urate oxidase/2-oxo-4-hydroxy-4-carboxy-5-ureidoimidazoline decarboxylase
MQQFASGWKRNYYGKGDVTVYRLTRAATATAPQVPVFGANVTMLVYGDAFWPPYTTGDNTRLIATDSMKNFIERETLNFAGGDLEDFCWFLGATFLETYPQTEGIQVSASEIPYAPMDAGAGFTPSGPERATARIELRGRTVVEAISGLRGFRLLRLGGGALRGFVRDQYTTLPDLHDQPLHMWLDLEWMYSSPMQFCSEGRVSNQVRRIVHDVFQAFESGSIQQVIYQMGARILSEVASIGDVHLEASDRTWDPIAGHGGEGGVYTDPRPSYGCVGVRLTR